MRLRDKILEKGELIQEPFVRLLESFEKRISALEKGVDPDGVSIDDLTDAEVVEATITYEGGTTATVMIVTQAVNQQEPEP